MRLVGFRVTIAPGEIVLSRSHLKTKGKESAEEGGINKKIGCALVAGNKQQH